MEGAEPDVRRRYRELLERELEAPPDDEDKTDYLRDFGRSTLEARAQAERQEAWLGEVTF
jgi:hypothetical protein